MTFNQLTETLSTTNTTLVAVSKTKPISAIQELYDRGQRIFGENRVQEMVEKHEALPKDIEWHMIGHLQTNKVKYMAPFVSLVHSVDNERLLKEINKQAARHDRTINILIQIKIATEASKSGWEYRDLVSYLEKNTLEAYQNIAVKGVMGMATFTDNKDQVQREFAKLKTYHEELSREHFTDDFDIISMGMSGDYELAIEEGANMVRIGSLLFGARN